MGGIIAGVGIGLSISQGGSTGGTDIIALLWCKFKNASPGRVILIIDVMIIISSILVPSYTDSGELLPFSEKLAVVVYGLIQVTVSGYAVDLYLSGSKQSVQAFIFTKKVTEMADENAVLMYKGHPLMRKDNLIYYGSMADSHIVMLQILETKKVGDADIATKVSVQLQLTDPAARSRDRLVKKSEKDGLYTALDFGCVWLERALAGK